MLTKLIMVPTKLLCLLSCHFRPEDIAEALIRLIEDDSLTGKALKVTKTFGQHFAEFVDTSVQ